MLRDYLENEIKKANDTISRLENKYEKSYSPVKRKEIEVELIKLNSRMETLGDVILKIDRYKFKCKYYKKIKGNIGSCELDNTIADIEKCRICERREV